MTDHQPNCRWEKLTAQECAYRDTHHYCPHEEHACTCVRVTKDIKILIKYPVKFEMGKIFDADDNHVLDIRGWGRLQYLPNPEDKQDAIGKFIAQAINEKLQQ